MTFILSYINTSDDTIYLDRPFRTMGELMEYIRLNCPYYTSYQVIVTS